MPPVSYYVPARVCMQLVDNYYTVRSLASRVYVEMREIDLSAKSDDGTLREDSYLSRWFKLLGEATVPSAARTRTFSR